MSQLKAYLQLLRAPATPTAVSNVLMGYLVANGSWSPVRPLVALVVATVALYSAGMVLNDLADFDEDRRLRPERPLSSGRIHLRRAAQLGWALLALGIVAAAYADGVAMRAKGIPPSWRGATVAVALAVAIIAYNFWLKRTWAGPLLLGGCRCLNVLLGMATGPMTSQQLWPGFTLTEWSIAIGIAGFVAGISWFARREAEFARRSSLIAAATLMIISLLWLASLPWWSLPIDPAQNGSLQVRIGFLFGIIAIPIFGRMIAAVLRPSPTLIQRAVTTSLLSLILIDAILCFAVMPSLPSYSLAVAGLLVPSLILARWAKAT